MRKFFSTVLLVLILSFTVCLAGCSSSVLKNDSAQDTQDITETTSALEDLTIVYTNDIHSYIFNTVTDSEGNASAGLRLSNVSALVNNLRNEGKNVLLVDAGDEIQGTIYGSLDQGYSVIQLMNAAGYQLACPGNHDFDYGVDNFIAVTEQADFPYICCNLFSLEDNSLLFPSTKIMDVNGTKIGFVGICTPETITSSTPAFFQNEDGDYIYSFTGNNDPEKLYDAVQSAVDSIRDEADYVIALSHLGVGSFIDKKGISSTLVIENTTGLDAVIDAHSHTVVEQEFVEDLDGNKVLLTQTGSYLQNVGIMKITSDGQFSSSLISAYDSVDSDVAVMEEELNEIVDEQMNQKIGTLSFSLYINSPDDSNMRIVRARETNLGDFVADSVYWYFNEVMDKGCDIALANGGGIRTSINSGDITYMDIKNVEPFGNQICLIKATGAEILDCLEMGATVAGHWLSGNTRPEENGGFMQVAGLTYTIDAGTESSVITDSNGMFKSVDGVYKVKNVKVYNRDSCTYEDLVPDREYTVGGINYILQNCGNGLSMFQGDDIVCDYVGQDADILALYMKSLLSDGNSTAAAQGSSLNNYSGYLIDYNNPYGSGRIDIINADYDITK